MTKPKEKWKLTGKSIWEGRDKEKVTIEMQALITRTWASKGLFCCNCCLSVIFLMNLFNRFHSETFILTTIFALLFWDVIFTDTLGAFKTPYQS